MRIRWRGLELPSRVVCNREKLTDTYGEFHVEPFERGFGHTVGNSLRRILLSSLEGSAVTKIKIQGVQHEFSSIPGMVEDITDLVLNLKGLVVKNHSEQTRTIRIDRDRRGVVTAADILHDESVEIINPDHILCTLTDDVPFVVEMTVENGRGYRPAAEGHTDDLEIGAIPDRRHLQPGHPRRVPGREHPRRPADQLRQAACSGSGPPARSAPRWPWSRRPKILRKHLNPFVQYYEPQRAPPMSNGPAVRASSKNDFGTLRYSTRSCIWGNSLIPSKYLL